MREKLESLVRELRAQAYKEDEGVNNAKEMLGLADNEKSKNLWQQIWGEHLTKECLLWDVIEKLNNILKVNA